MKRVTRPKRRTLMHAASRMIICSFFMSRHFYGAAMFTTDCSAGLAAAKVCPFFLRYSLSRYIEAMACHALQSPAIPLQTADRCSAPITYALARTLCGEKKERESEKFRMPALSILIGSSEPWQDLYSPNQ